MSLENYEKQSKLGEGTYGVVYKAIDKRTGETVALKRIKLDHEDEGIPPTTVREISILKELNHPNVVRLNEVVNSQGKITLVFEYLDKDLKSFLSKQSHSLDPLLIKSYSYQILAGLCYCHCHRIIHRDMKPENLLLNRRGLIKICDFGLARAFTIPLRNYTHEVVTLWYRPPEILLGSKSYSLPVDIWSVGCIIAQMFTRQPLFPGDSEIDELYKIFQILGTPNEKIWPEVTQLPSYKPTFPQWRAQNLESVLNCHDPLLVDLISQMLRYDPASRITARDALDHPYFNDLPSDVKSFKPTEIEPIQP